MAPIEKEAYTQRAVQLLEDGAKADGTTLTQNQCAALIEYLQERFAEANPYVVANVSRADGSWSVNAYPTMRQALTAPRYPGCQTPIVFGSWADYEIWKTKHLATPTPAGA